MESIVKLKLIRLPLAGHDFVSMLLCLFAATVASAAEPQPVTHRVTGLFSSDRLDDLREVIKTHLPEVKLVSIDDKTSEAVFIYDADKLFNSPKPEQIVERFDNLLRTHSQGTFGIRPVCSIPRDKLKWIEIPVVGLDCKGCCLGAYEAIYKIEGVEQATASFKDGLVTALTNPELVNRAALEEALKKKGVALMTP